jgi:hypothetical protein
MVQAFHPYIYILSPQSLKIDFFTGRFSTQLGTCLGTGVLGTSPSSTLGEFEVETAQQTILAAVHVDHLPECKDRKHQTSGQLSIKM